MRDFSSESSGVRFMSALVEASHLLRELAEPRPGGDRVKAAMLRAWRRFPQWHWSRVRDVWYGDLRVTITADELRDLRKAAAARRAQEAANEARTEYQQFEARIARLEQMLRVQDADFHGTSIAALGSVRGKDDSALG